MPDLGWQELMIILVIVIIIFGAGKLPEIGGALGKSMKEFKKASEGEEPSLPRQTATNETVASSTVSSSAGVSQGVRAEDI
ncbi:MAG TPA: twin-arginine translocase TatA/TatE family subunit [Thermomicrobiales bacterium]|jgi:sec-independent protein translocase protein TatA